MRRLAFHRESLCLVAIGSSAPMKIAILIITFLSSFVAHALTIDKETVEGKWQVKTIAMGDFGEMPAGDNEFFIFQNGNLSITSSIAKDSKAQYSIENDRIVTIYPNKIEKLKVIELQNNKMVFVLELYKGDKKMSADNIIYTLVKQ